MSIEAKPPTKIAEGDLPEGLPEDIRASFKPRSVLTDSSIDVASRGKYELMLSNVGRMDPWSVCYASTSPASDPDVRTRPLGQNDFILRRIIGKGGFGEVWEATQGSLGRVIAIKRMRMDLFKDTVVSSSTCHQVELGFQQEALTAAALDHPNIVPVYDLGKDAEGRTMLAMKRVKGRPWDELIEEDSDLMAPEEFLLKHVAILVDMAHAAGFAHSRGIVHRDLKPSQVMVGDFGEVLLMDWGLAVVFNRDKAHMEGSHYIPSGLAPTTDSAPNPAGTIAFMAPEQTDKTCERIGPWTDVWLLGGTLYFLLTGQTPHHAAGNVIAFYKAMKGEIEPPKKRTPNRYIPEELEELAMKALEPNIDKRLQCAQHFVKELQDYLNGASQKAESIRLTNAVESTLGSETVSYLDLGRALLSAENARNLWPRNPNSRMQLVRISRRMVQLALQKSDLSLARLHADRLSAEADHAEIEAAVAKAEHDALCAVKQRKIYARVSIAALAALFILAVAYAKIQHDSGREMRAANERLALQKSQVEQERARAITEAENAAKARRDAERLLNFVVSDVGQEIAATGRAEALQKITDGVESYYRSSSASQDDSPEALHNRIIALRLIADSDLAQGNVKEASDTYGLAISASSIYLKQHPNDAEILAESARISKGLANIELSSGDEARALSSALSAKTQIEAARIKDPKSPEWELEEGLCQYLVSFIYYSQGDWDTALRNFVLARGTIESLASRFPDNMAYQQQLAELLVAQAHVVWQLGRPDEALDVAAESLETNKQVLHREPWNLVAELASAISYRTMATILYERDRLADAEEAILASIGVIERLTQIDPAAKKRQFELLISRNIYGSILSRERKYDEALAVHRDILKTLDTTGKDFADPRAIKLARAETLIRMGDAQKPTDETLAGESYTAALAELKSLDLVSRSDTSWKLEWEARVLMELGRSEEAKPLLRDLETRNWRRRDLYEPALERGIIEKNTTDTPYRMTVIGN